MTSPARRSTRGLGAPAMVACGVLLVAGVIMMSLAAEGTFAIALLGRELPAELPGVLCFLAAFWMFRVGRGRRKRVSPTEDGREETHGDSDGNDND